MNFPNKAKYITFYEGDLNNDGIFNNMDLRYIKPGNEMRFSVAYRKINFISEGKARSYESLFNKKGTILLNSNILFDSNNLSSYRHHRHGYRARGVESSITPIYREDGGTSFTPKRGKHLRSHKAHHLALLVSKVSR